MGKGDKACLVSCSTRIKSCHEKIYGKRRQGMPCLLFDPDQIMPRKNVWEKETRHALSLQQAYRSSFHVKLIILPIRRIILDVFRNSLVGTVVPDNMVMETGLPIEIQSQSVGMSGYRRFVGTDNG